MGNFISEVSRSEVRISLSTWIFFFFYLIQIAINNRVICEFSSSTIRPDKKFYLAFIFLRIIPIHLFTHISLRNTNNFPNFIVQFSRICFSHFFFQRRDCTPIGRYRFIRSLFWNKIDIVNVQTALQMQLRFVQIKYDQKLSWVRIICMRANDEIIFCQHVTKPWTGTR